MPMASVGRSMLWSLLEQGLSKGIALVVEIVIARLLAPEAFGTLAILLVFVNVADAVAQSGLNMALIQRPDASEADFSTAFWLSLALAGVMYAGIFIGAPYVAQFYQSAELAFFMRGLAVVLPLNAFNSIQKAFLQRNFHFKKLFYVSSFSVLVSGVIGVVGAWVGLGTWALIAQRVANSAISCIALLRVVSWRPAIVFVRSSAKCMLLYGWKVCATVVIDALYSGLSDLVIGKVCTKSELGLYSQGRKYPGALFSIVVNALQNVLFPAFSRLQDDLPALRDVMRKALVTGTYILIPACFLLALLAEPLIMLLLTEKWIACVPIFQMFCLSSSLTVIQLVNLKAYMAVGRSDLYLKLEVLKVLFGGVLIIGTAVATANIYAVAFASCMAAILSIVIIDLQPAKATLGFSRISQLKSISPNVAVALVSSLVGSLAYLLEMDPLLEACLCLVLFCSSVLAVSILFRLEGFRNVRSVSKELLRKS